MDDKKRLITLRLNERDIEAMDTLASRYGWSRAELVRQLVRAEILTQAHDMEFMSAKSSTDQIDEAIHSLKSGAVD